MERTGSLLDTAPEKSDKKWAKKLGDLQNRVDSKLEALERRMMEKVMNNKAKQPTASSTGSARTDG